MPSRSRADATWCASRSAAILYGSVLHAMLTPWGSVAEGVTQGPINARRGRSGAVRGRLTVGFGRRLQWQLSKFSALQMSSEHSADQQISSVTGRFTKRQLRWRAF